MHKYLSAVGFSKIKNRTQLNELLAYIIRNADEKKYTSTDDTEILFAEYSKDFADSIGLTIRGEFNEDNQFTYDYFFPHCTGARISSYEDISVERHAEKESYAGVCDDIKIGVSLIFYLQNVVSYLKIRNAGRLPIKGTSLNLGALSVKGTILMPIQKNEKDKKRIRKDNINRNKLIAAARNGDEEAIESLTLEDMDTYTNISRKIRKEDILSLVDTYFMPYGVECDHYSILGEIIEYKLMKNNLTAEEIYQMSINCNDLIFSLIINKQDLVGEPNIGRRFKGVIWMQGYINFPA